VSSIVFWFLGRAFAACAALDSEVKKEVSAWDESAKIMLKIEPFGPCVSLMKKDGKLIFLRLKETDAGLAVYFKSMEGALLVLTGRIGIDRAYAEHRFGMRGDIGFGMSMVRCLTRVEAYLFPKFITKKILKRIPEKETSSIKVYMTAVFGIK
jgi:hypothetical protein